MKINSKKWFYKASEYFIQYQTLEPKEALVEFRNVNNMVLDFDTSARKEALREIFQIEKYKSYLAAGGDGNRSL